MYLTEGVNESIGNDPSMKYFQERGTIYIINVYLKALIPRNQLKDRVYASEVHYLEICFTILM